MSQPRAIEIAKVFSRFPAGRVRADGPYSGEAFRDAFLIGPLKQGIPLIVGLDGTAGYGSSFLEEAFGGLVRAGIDSNAILRLVELKSADQSLVDEIVGYIQNAGDRA